MKIKLIAGVFLLAAVNSYAEVGGQCGRYQLIMASGIPIMIDTQTGRMWEKSYIVGDESKQTVFIEVAVQKEGNQTFKTYQDNLKKEMTNEDGDKKGPIDFSDLQK